MGEQGSVMATEMEVDDGLGGEDDVEERERAKSYRARKLGASVDAGQCVRPSSKGKPRRPNQVPTTSVEALLSSHPKEALPPTCHPLFANSTVKALCGSARSVARCPFPFTLVGGERLTMVARCAVPRRKTWDGRDLDFGARGSVVEWVGAVVGRAVGCLRRQVYE